MSGRGKILVVDDEPFNREIMQEILQDEYDLCFAASGQECLDIAPQQQPQLILLDISMPGLSGYEVCKQIRGDVRTKDIQVTFVSALDTLADRLAGYEVGGDDYITKPFDANELLRKVQIALKNKEIQRNLKQNADAAMKTAVNAITSTNEIGAVLQFLSAGFNCQDYDGLAQLVIDTIAAFGYQCTVQIRAGQNDLNKCSEGAINPLEVAVIKRISSEDQQIDIGPRTIINFSHISLLIKGMPVNDEEEYMRLKENMAVVAEGAEMRINAIEAQNEMLNKVGLLEVISHAQNAIAQLNQQQSTHKSKLTVIMRALADKIQNNVSEFKLDESVENSLTRAAAEASNAVLALFEDEKEIEEKITGVMHELQDAMNQ